MCRSRGSATCQIWVPSLTFGCKLTDCNKIYGQFLRRKFMIPVRCSSFNPCPFHRNGNLDVVRIGRRSWYHWHVALYNAMEFPWSCRPRLQLNRCRIWNHMFFKIETSKRMQKEGGPVWNRQLHAPSHSNRMRGKCSNENATFVLGFGVSFESWISEAPTKVLLPTNNGVWCRWWNM